MKAAGALKKAELTLGYSRLVFSGGAALPGQAGGTITPACTCSLAALRWLFCCLLPGLACLCCFR